MDNMISNMQHLGDDVDPKILLIPGFCHIHCESHSEFECPCCQNTISRVLSKVAASPETSGKGVNTIMVPKKEITNKDAIQNDVIMNESPIVVASQLAPEVVELCDDPTLSYSDTSFDGGGLLVLFDGIVTNPRR